MIFKLIKSTFGAATLFAASVYGAVVGLALVIGTDRGFATEPGNLGNTLAGATIGAPIAAAAPPGVYGIMETFLAPGVIGTGQAQGSTLDVPLWAPTLLWSTGYKFLGASVSAALVQPTYYVTSHPTNGASLAGNASGPPFGNAIDFPTVANTLITPVLLS